jgi:shikimate kinase
VTPVVALIGFMGAGKSTVGRSLADRLGVPFTDTDALVTAGHGPIAAIFADRGEATFREWEREEVVLALGSAGSCGGVVSLGGGAVTIADVREALSRLAHVVWLDAPLDLLFARASDGGRPLARDRKAFEGLYASRRPLYAGSATSTVRLDEGTTVDEAVDLVVAQVSR